MQLGNEVDGQPFIPGIYRMLAQWPGYLAHVSAVLRPHFDDPVTKACCAELLRFVDDAAAGRQNSSAASISGDSTSR